MKIYHHGRRATKEFQEKLANFEDGKELYKGMHNLLRQTYPPTIGGSIPMELRTAHPVGFFDGKVIPVSWSLTSERILKLAFTPTTATL